MKIEDFFKSFTVNPIFRLIGRAVERKHFSGKPIFIVASPRSGTTLLLSILGAHPNIYAIPHQTYAFARWKSIRDRSYKYFPTRIDRLYRYLIFHKIKLTANRWCEKTPRHIRSISEIVDYYNGDVKIIHIIRDGRDVAVSSHPTHTGRHYWVPVDKWVKDVRSGLKYKDEAFIHNVHYEDLVSDHISEAKKIFQFLEEDFTAKIENWVQETNIKRSIHWKENVQSVHKKALGKWKTPEHAEKMEEFFSNENAVELLKELGYK
jgi:sulfotransferase family protein